MHGLWIDAGNDPVWERISAHGISRLYFPLSDPAADVRRRLLEARDRGYIGGVYSAWNWYGEPSGAAFATEVDRALTVVAPDATPKWPKVMLDDERHEPNTLMSLFAEWRRRRRDTDTAWTLESMQGGWFTDTLVNAVVAAKVRVVPQCYQGDMTPVDTLAAARDLTKRGIPDSLVTPFYSAASLPVAWDGFAFTMGTLP